MAAQLKVSVDSIWPYFLCRLGADQGVCALLGMPASLTRLVSDEAGVIAPGERAFPVVVSMKKGLMSSNGR